nr:DUF1028 domain-containing protein [Pseudoclavibacter sp. Marseille-Q3772]
MTFSVLLRDPQTGELGAAVSSSSPAVAARCLNLADGVGAASSQNVTDPRLGHELLAHLKNGQPAGDALSTVLANADSQTLEYRQLVVLDADGNSAVHSGERSLGTYGSRSRPNIVAAGNMLASLEVLEALVSTVEQTSGTVEDRLVAGLRAALAAGGEEGPLHSAGLAVVGDAGWRVTDLRVDWSDDPIGDLADLVQVWMPQKADYITRGIDPTKAPSYGVPGDE